jgi:rRNA maturation endonuclease Nob1
MNVTEELRRLLEERGMEYRFNESTKVFEWHFDGTDGEGSAHATEVNGGINIIACSLTPEQAVEATLGRRTCHVMTIGEFNDEGTEYYDRCSNCGYEFDDDPPNYCPNCGRKVVSE